jgi:transcriptional regulator with XRE-family HTH domain
MDGTAESSLGERIRTSREAKNLTQKELADRIGKDEAVISKWERGKNLPQKGNITLLAEALDVDTFWLKNGIRPTLESSSNQIEDPARDAPPSRRLVAGITALDTPTRQFLEETLDSCFRKISRNQTLTDDDVSLVIKFVRDLTERGRGQR